MKQTLILFTSLTLLTGSMVSSLSAQDLVRRLTQDEAMKAATAKVQPEYPAIAKQLKLEGAVQVEASIDEKGTVESAKVVSGNVVLANSAIAAIKRWKFSPILVDGKPAKASATLSFTFRL